MARSPVILLGVLLLAVRRTSLAVPVSVVNSGGNPEEAEVDDDSTTHTLERLSSAATCLVAGVEYTHGQQIYREDPCEFCLCLDGEMFCWWQDCPPTLEGPCRERSPYSPCLNGPRTPTVAGSGTTEANVEPSTPVNETATEEEVETTPDTAVPEKVCTVMGRTYQIGARLPHDTGNCVECVCGATAQVTCSPHHCSPADDDFGQRQPQPDAF